MSESGWKAFVSFGTRTGKLATTRSDGRPHVMPVWFVLDGDDLVFMTGAETVKGRALRRTGSAALCVDDERPPYALVTVSGAVTIIDDDPEQLLRYSTAIAERYMGPELADEYGRRNAVPGELLVRLHADHVYAVSDVAG